MMDIEEFYFTGEAIETKIGHCHFLTIREYTKYCMYLQYVGMTKNQIINLLSEMYKGKDLKSEINELNKYSLFQLVFSIYEFKVAYINLFVKVFKNEDILSLINEDNFYSIRHLILKMNCMKEEKVNPNPEIQSALERSRRVKSREGEKLTLGDMASAIVGYNGLSYKDINEFTIYQLYLTYYRIGHLKNYDTSTLFATVSSEKVKIDSWSKHIDLFEEEKHVVEHGKFKKTTGSVLSE